MLYLHLIVSLIYFLSLQIQWKIQPEKFNQEKKHSFKITVLEQTTRPVCYDGEDIYYFPKFYSGNTKTWLKNISLKTETIKFQSVLLHLRYAVLDHFKNDVRFACAYPTTVGIPT
jgi:tRNA A22 N-methylase